MRVFVPTTDRKVIEKLLLEAVKHTLPPKFYALHAQRFRQRKWVKGYLIIADRKFAYDQGDYGYHDEDFTFQVINKGATNG